MKTNRLLSLKTIKLKIMKTIKLKILTGIITLFILSIIILPACNEGSEEASNTEEINTEQLTTIEIKVEGMTCTGCENTVTNAIMELSGINHAKLSHIDGNAIIEFDNTKTSREEIVDAVKGSGYKVVE